VSLLKRLFGGKSFEELCAEADGLRESDQLGQAKLAYERALDRAKGVPEAERQRVQERIDECLDGIARGRIEQAREHGEAGELDLAREELEGAIVTAVSEDVIGEARRLIDGMEAEDAVTRASEDVELSDEEKIAALAGSWEEEQDEEYAGYDDDFYEALVAFYDERYEDAHPLLESTLEKAEEPRYLWLEVGRARLLTGDTEGGEKALRTFLELLEEGEGGDARQTAHRELASLLDERDDEDGALAELQAAVEELPEDPRPYFTMGAYLRRKGHSTEAVEVLEAAMEMWEGQPSWRLQQELGMALADAGEDDRAIEQLEALVATFVARRQYDFPPEATVTLARLHEKAGKAERAADLYRSLTRGSDRRNHLGYHLEAARLLGVLGLEEEARRMVQRASALAADDPEAMEAVAARRGELGLSEEPTEDELEEARAQQAAGDDASPLGAGALEGTADGGAADGGTDGGAEP